MPTIDLDYKDSIGLPSYAQQIGTDRNGAIHYIDPRKETVYVVANDRIKIEQDVSDRSVGEWMGYVEKERGWANRRYSSGNPFREMAEEIA